MQDIARAGRGTCPTGQWSAPAGRGVARPSRRGRTGAQGPCPGPADLGFVAAGACDHAPASGADPGPASPRRTVERGR